MALYVDGKPVMEIAPKLYGGSPVVTFTTTLSSSQYGWFTFKDENDNDLSTSDGVPLMASCFTNNKYYHALTWEQTSNNTYLFKVADINDTNGYKPVGTQLSNLQFECAYVKTNMASEIFAPIIYSTEEREIGVWTDGKPLYQNTWIFSSTLLCITNTWVDTDISNSSFDKIVKSICANAAGTVYDCFAGNCNANSGYIQLLNTRNTNTGIDVLTLQYTKTTDVAGSGTWTPQGVPAHHYSTSEQVIGTWLNGKTLYEKTWYFQSSMISIGTNWTSLNINVSDLNIDEIVDNRAQSYKSQSMPIGVWNDSGTLKANYWQNGLNIGSITIRYTKVST